ncbi:hypothetical protein MRX96_013265 [Rhipicephalus microplus]
MQALTDMELARLEQGGPRHGGSLLSLHTSLPSRTSLLGKPLKVGAHPRDAKYRKKQTFMYNFLERPRGYRAAAYHIFLSRSTRSGVDSRSNVPRNVERIDGWPSSSPRRWVAAVSRAAAVVDRRCHAEMGLLTWAVWLAAFGTAIDWKPPVKDVQPPSLLSRCLRCNCTVLTARCHRALSLKAQIGALRHSHHSRVAHVTAPG